MVHTGKGKGKSTAAFGMVFRAIGHGIQGRHRAVRQGRLGDRRARRAREIPRPRHHQGHGRRLHLGHRRTASATSPLPAPPGNRPRR
ncbi:MAG: cob(I)yrinic acid a,c-diamide adenosyltransferase [Candidatus Promineifilaceae bacterium]